MAYQYTDEYLMSLSGRDALKLNRDDRRRRAKLLKEQNKKIGISSVDKSNSDKITLSQAELKRLVDAQVKAKIQSIDEYRSAIFKKITYEMFYIISYVMHKHYGFGVKRMNKFIKFLFDTYYDVYMDDDWQKTFNESKFDAIRNEMRTAFDIQFLEQEYDDANNVINTTVLDEQKIYNEVRGKKNG